MNVQQQTPGNLEPDEWRVLVDLVPLIRSSAPEGAKALPTEIVPATRGNGSGTLRQAHRIGRLRFSTTRQFWKIVVDPGVIEVILFP